MATIRTRKDGKLVVTFTPREAARQGFVMGNAATVAAPARPKVKTKAEMKAGNGYSCAVNGSCKAQTRTYERSTIHATPATLQAAGHLERA